VSELLRLARHTMRLSWQADRRATTAVALIVLFEAVSSVLFALAQRWVVDTAFEETVLALTVAAVIGGLAWAVNAAGNRIVTNLQYDLSERIDLTLNKDVLRISTRLRTLEHLERPEYLDRVTLLGRSIDRLAMAGMGLFRAGSASVSVILSVILLSGVHLALGLLVLLALPPLWMSMLAQRLRERARQQAAADERRDDRLHRLAIESGSAQQIRVMRAEKRIDRWADESRARQLHIQVRGLAAATGWEVAGWAVYAAGFAVTLVVAVGMVGTGATTLGGLVLTVTLATRLRSEVRRAVGAVKQVADASTAAGHYMWLRELDRRATREAGTRLVGGPVRRIELRAVGFTYPGATEPVLKDVNLVLTAGQTIAVVGLNGAGKTTLVKLLMGMYAPTAGEVLLDGVPLNDVDTEHWRRLTSGAFQDSVRLKTTVAEAVGAGDIDHMNDSARVRKAIETTGIDEFVDRLPDGEDTLLDRSMGGHELSGGQWQRLALARAHMRSNPNLQVLDEPTAALDPQAEYDMHKLYAERTENAPDRITLLVSHRFSTVRMADLIVVLRHGTVVEAGTHTSLMDAEGAYAELYESQAQQYR
jgi:ATP-binding cassette, subfamily B, bacterial